MAIKKGAKTLRDIKADTTACTGNKCATLNPSGKCCAADIISLLNNSNSPDNCTCCE